MNIRFVGLENDLQKLDWFQTQIDIPQTKRVVLVKFEIRTVKLMGNRKRANRVYIGDSENQHLISLSVVFNRE